MRPLPLLAIVALSSLAAAAPPAQTRMADPYWTLLQAKDRSDDDRKEDDARKPLDVLRFLEVKPAMKVADLGAGGGYTTELLARAVGPKGTVYSQNTKLFLEKFIGPKWDERLKKPINKNVVRVERDFDDPLPPEAKDLDLVVNAFTYHDTVWVGVDRDKMNKAVFEHLKPGGRYVILDHEAKAGDGTNDTKTLHRIESKAVIDDMKKAGFTEGKRGDFMKNADDAHDKNVFDPSVRGKTDRFALTFVKPAK